jgi:hypothetical protein
MIKKRLNRQAAATYVSETYGVPLSPRTLEATPVPFIVVNGHALYEVEDLDRYAQGKIAAASRRLGGRGGEPVQRRDDWQAPRLGQA